MTKSWDDRFADLLERAMATAAAVGDPRPLQEELKKLMAEKPKKPKEEKDNGTES